jgi:CubicO group peptidase (beta-lactamase class C family)
VPTEKLDRLPTCYQSDFARGGLKVFEPAGDRTWSHPPAFPSARGGLVSTVDDYLAFGQMMLNKGRHGRERILSRPSVETMTTDQLTPEQRATAGFFLDNRGWGFGLSVVIRREDLSAIPGRFGWDGGYGTSWYSDPREELVAILMTQRMWDSPEAQSLYLDFWTSTYQAIDD